MPHPETVQPWLEKRLTPARLTHVAGVVETAVELCRQLDLDEATIHHSTLAALLHDNAKQLPHLADKLKEYGYELTALEQQMPAVWHAWIGADEAQSVWHIDNEEILNAIRFHTTGRPDMSLTEQIVYVADKIESRTRDQALVSRWHEGVDHLRQVSSAPLLTCWMHVLVDSNLLYLAEQHGVIHPLTMALQQHLNSLCYYQAGGSPT